MGSPSGAPPSPVPGPAPVAGTPSRRALRLARRWRLPTVPLAIAIVCVIGAGLLLFPTIVSWFSQYEQSQRITELTDDVADLSAETLAERLREARRYNSELVDGGASIAANERLPLAEQPEQEGDYAAVLRADANGLMARLKIPAIDVDLPIYHGTSADVLDHGVGHLEGTAVPVGGVTTHSVLTAHRGLATSELFTHLDRVELDDTFTVEVFGEVLTYRVIDTRVVEPTETQSLLPVDGRDLITLVTCTPLGVNSHRILVTGERVIPTPQVDVDGAGERPEIPTFPWWVLIAVAVLTAAALYVWWSGRPARPARASAAAGGPGATRPAPKGVPSKGSAAAQTRVLASDDARSDRGMRVATQMVKVGLFDADADALAAKIERLARVDGVEVTVAASSLGQLLTSPSFPPDVVVVEQRPGERVSVNYKIRVCRLADARVIVVSDPDGERDDGGRFEPDVGAMMTPVLSFEEALSRIRH
ncbi:hypothetical protein GCM10017602_26160 [Herbiconiux flava]|nr:hypothetical protein GCM10017602_26160 [Herbiconiux flava]